MNILSEHKLTLNALYATLADYDIIVFSKTWSHNAVNEAELGLSSRSTVLRCDSCDGVRGGGVLIAINNRFFCHRIILQNNILMNSCL